MPGVGIQLADEDKLTVWDWFKSVKGEVIDFPVRIEFHELDYPAKAPAVGFAVSFGYYQTGQGAEFEQTGGSWKVEFAFATLLLEDFIGLFTMIGLLVVQAILQPVE